MSNTLATALVGLVPASMLLAGSIISFSKARSMPSFLQLFGAAFLMIYVLIYVAEALNLFPWKPDDVAHYLDLWSFVGLTLFTLGYFWQSLTHAPVSQPVKG